MATTHTEIYRRFEGKLAPPRLRFLPLYLFRLRVAHKKKLPLLLLFAPPAISGIVFSFIVYTKFTLEAVEIDPQGGGLPALLSGRSIAARIAGQLTEVHQLIVEFNMVIRTFALLALAWFGAGLIADDRKAGAHLLYFSRPITRRDYFLGHFCTAAHFGLCALLVPSLVICIVAVFSSPDFSFLKEKWDVIVATIGYSLLYVATVASIVLAVSSLASRKSYALAGVFGLFVPTQAVAIVVAELKQEPQFHMLSLWANLQRLADWMLGARAVPQFDWNPWYSLGIVAFVIALSASTVAWRLRRMEVVA